ncbi:MAG: alpha-D-ribose 1-methylphosphonate 5-triphosphate diphosphatase [Desulfovermiculus sp.]|nr:alpha-D-ribose 1-methylphosphonate 5-triphosphate diphosphatase [Desulfovermiculus sp.]
MSKYCLYGGPLFDGQNLHPSGHVCMEGGRIIGFGPGRPPEANRIFRDVGGRLICPGFVDLHCDALEKCIEPRPGATFDYQYALQGLDRRLAASGVTSFCHAVAFLDEEMGLRSPHTAADMIRAIWSFQASNRALVRHEVHIRFEVGGILSAEVIQNLLNTQNSTLFSVMDHSPGQGQFKSLESFMSYFGTAYAISRQEVEALGIERAENNHRAWEDSLDLIHEVRARNIPIFSHDDDTSQKVEKVRDLGAAGCEFPVSLQAAELARDMGMLVCMGAPNLLRGCSTNNNVTAAQVIHGGLCDILVSDYFPECLTQAPFFAHRELGMALAESLTTVTANPGQLLQTEKTSPGRLQIGAEADIAVLDTGPPWVRVWETWVGGQRVYAAH